MRPSARLKGRKTEKFATEPFDPNFLFESQKYIFFTNNRLLLFGSV
jgi:hypothetical protein